MTYALLKRPEQPLVIATRSTRPGSRRRSLNRASWAAERYESRESQQGSAVREPDPRAGELRFGSPDDPVEHEADRIADEVVSRRSRGSRDTEADKPVSLTSRHDSDTVRRQFAPTIGATQASDLRAPPQFTRLVRHEQVHAGRPLDPEIRVPLERALASDFSRVQVHDDDRAARLVRQARAQAFTIGSDVFFDRGALKRDRAGQRLVAHELAHVAQQPSVGTTVRRKTANPSPGATPEDERRAAAAEIRRLAGDAAGKPEFVAGDMLTGEEFMATVVGVRRVAAGNVAMRISGESDEHFVVPLPAMKYNLGVPGPDAQHRSYTFKDTAEGKLWEAKLAEADDRRKTAHAARRIVSSKKMIAAFGAVGVAGGVGFGAGLLGAGLAAKFGGGMLAKGMVAGGLGGTLEGSLSGGALAAIDGGTAEQARAAALSGGLWGGGIGLGLGGVGVLAAPWVQGLRAGGPRAAKVAEEVATTGYVLPKPSLAGRAGRAPPPAVAAQVEHLRPAPDIFAVAPAREYAPDGNFLLWRGFQKTDLPLQTYKLHFSATVDNVTDVAQVLLPELKRLGVPHKIIKSKAAAAALSEEQAGKFITVYPRSLAEGRVLRMMLGRKLRVNGITGRRNFIPVPGEAPMGMSGGVFTRYGASVEIYAKGGGGGIFRVNGLGQAVDKTGAPVLYRGKPIKLSEPLPKEHHENIINLLYRDGVVERDLRGQVRPEWAPVLE